MAEHRTDEGVDERASAALDALRDAGSEPGGPPGGWSGGGAWPSFLARVDAELAHRWPEGPQASTVVAGAALLLVVVLGGGWLALRSTSAGATGGVPVTLPFTTTIDTATGPAAGTAGPEGSSGPGSSDGSRSTDGGTEAADLVVHAAGAVALPGVHEVPAGARVADVLAAAGGPTAEADLDRVNLAAPVADGERLYVPRHGEAAPPTIVTGQGGGASSAESPGGAGAGGAAGSGGEVDLNTATADELDALPGVGPATAQAILAHRDRHGPFTSVEQLLDVRGIGPAKLDALRDLVTLG